jgi:hypothetical protein
MLTCEHRGLLSPSPTRARLRLARSRRLPSPSVVARGASDPAGDPFSAASERSRAKALPARSRTLPGLGGTRARLVSQPTASCARSLRGRAARATCARAGRNLGSASRSCHPTATRANADCRACASARLAGPGCLRRAGGLRLGG